MDTPLRIGSYELHSRLIVGTGKYPSLDVMQRAHEASGTAMVTVAIRRIRLDDPTGKTMLDYVDRSRYTILPNTAGCATAKDAVLTAQLARGATRHRSHQIGSDRRSAYALSRYGRDDRCGERTGRRRLYRSTIYRRRSDGVQNGWKTSAAPQ